MKNNLTLDQIQKIKTLVAYMGAATSAYKEYARGWNEKGHTDPFKSTRLEDFERAFEDGKNLLHELEEE